MNRTVEDVYDYFREATKSLYKDHPHYNEIKRLLIDQINDELETIYSSTG
tara:strand:- start:2858 stop:3007 length:150 start_codon:yes stop_codon:yes gene_type:complete